MFYKGAHSDVNPHQAVEFLRKDPGLPINNPLPALWQDPPNQLLATHQSQHLSTETDVVIIGSGITGTSIARHLLGKDANVKVTMLEARTITSGATGRNGGHILVIPELFYAGLAAARDKHQAKDFIKFTFDNQDALLGLTVDLSPYLRESSELRQLEVLHVFSSELARSNAQTMIDLLAKEYPDVRRKNQILTKEEMLEKHGIRNSFGGATMLAGAVWPYRLISGLLVELWRNHGERFFIETQTSAESITWSAESQKYTIQTPRGNITATHVIHATNAHAGHLLPSIRGFLHPLRCQVTVQEKQPDFTNRGAQNSFVITNPRSLLSVYQSSKNGDFYVSGLTGTGDFFEEFTTREDTNTSAMVEGLSTIMNKTFGSPVQGRIKANWTGIMGYTADGAPMVGRLGQDITARAGTNEYIAAGYNGVGMVTAWLSGEHVADLVLGKGKPREIPSFFGISRERMDMAPLENILARPYGTWE